MNNWTGDTAHARTLVIRALLNHPLIYRRGAGQRIVDLARTHHVELRTWFDHHLGWQLRVDRDRIRLFKVPEAPGQQGNEAPSARQCALYCLTLAVLEDCGHQTVISELAEKITALTTTHATLRRFDATVRGERADLVAMVRLLADQGVLAPERDGSLTREDERDYIAGSGDALYNVDHRAAALLLATSTPPTLADGPHELISKPPADDAQTLELGLHHALMRRLVDDPAVYLEDLPSDQRTYFLAHSEELLQAIRVGLDVRVEMRAEGVAIIDEELTDLPFPKNSTASFAALVLADALACEAAPTAAFNVFIGDRRLRELGAQVAAALLQLTQKINGHPIDTERTLKAALPILNRLGLLTLTTGGIRVRPALARYRAPAGQHARKISDDLMLFGAEELTDTSGNGSDDHLF
ncbi:TIGR02678 family protein [Streptomyces sp. NPDC005167]